MRLNNILKIISDVSGRFVYYVADGPREYRNTLPRSKAPPTDLFPAIFLAV